MALHISSSCFAVMCHSRVHRIRATAAASEGSSTLNTVTEEKMNLGKSDLKVTRLGIGAWSWGDTTYWNDLEWNGALGWRLTEEEVAELRSLASEIKPVIGFPVENL
ncbi:hypothetical protein V8G54_031753 [Vigna mungo]|uniref:NADP-dependent oxidoreductase domain-containing protein n=1 Tax=Vigna mungo TaxID=3915 RepID=A0AAQ3RI73_VIGMU